jgi:hypothetical protein
MNKKNLLLLGAVVLFLLGAMMIYLGIQSSLIPPSITGMGFLVIGFVFLGLRD